MKDWALALLMGAIGIVMAAGAMTGWYGTPVELALWTLVGIGWVLVARTRAARPWLTVMGAGVASGVFADIMQAAFLAVLVTRNDAWAEFSVDGATRFQAFYSALSIGAAWGGLFGGITWLIGFLASRRRPAMAT